MKTFFYCFSYVLVCTVGVFLLGTFLFSVFEYGIVITVILKYYNIIYKCDEIPVGKML